MSAEQPQPNPPAQPAQPEKPAVPATVKKADVSAVHRLLTRKGAEDAQHDVSMRRETHNRLRHALAVATNLREAAHTERVQIISDSRSWSADPARINLRLAENQARIDQAVAEEAQAAEALAAFEAAEELREHGRIGDIVMMLVLTVEAQAARIAALEAN